METQAVKLARRAVQSKHWRWADDMKHLRLWLQVETLPDVVDVATINHILHRLQEVNNDAELTPVFDPLTETWYIIKADGSRIGTPGGSKAEAIINALCETA